MGVTREIVLRAGTERVWAALTSADRLSAWFGARVEPGLTAGGRVTFTWPDGTTRDARVEALDPYRMIVLRWLPFERTPGGVRHRPASLVRFTLVPVQGGSASSSSRSRRAPAIRDRSKSFPGSSRPGPSILRRLLGGGCERRAHRRDIHRPGGPDSPARDGAHLRARRRERVGTCGDHPMGEAVGWMAEVGAQWDERLGALRRLIEH